MPRTSTNPCFPLLVIILLILSGCQAKNKKDPATEALRLSLENADRINNTNTGMYIASIQRKSSDPCTAEVASYWLPKAEKVIDLSNTIKNKVKEYYTETGTSSGNIAGLLVELKKYKRDVLSIDSSYLLEFANQFAFIEQVAYLLTGDSTASDFTTGKKSDEKLLSCISILQNGITSIECKLLAYSHSKIGCTGGGFQVYSGIVSQNKEFVRPGENMKITAGMGALNTESKPVIRYYGKEIPLNEMGLADYSFKAPSIPGKYYVPVTISFRDPTVNKQVEQSFTVKYTVEEPCNQ